MFDFGCFLPLKIIIKKKQKKEPTGKGKGPVGVCAAEGERPGRVTVLNRPGVLKKSVIFVRGHQGDG